MTRHSRKRGFNLIEAAIVLAVVGLVIGGIWIAAANMYENYKINKTVEGVGLLVKNIQNLISSRDAEQLGPNATLDAFLISSKAVPLDWISDNNIKNSFGNAVTIQSQVSYFRIHMVNINKSTCIRLAQNETNNNKDIVALRVVRRDNSAVSVSTHNFPISLNGAENACQEPFSITLDYRYTRTN